MKQLIFKNVGSLVITALLLITHQAQATINTLELNEQGKFVDSGIAIRGYDTVAYFTQGRAQRGNEQFSTQWKNATWLFSSAEHLRLFQQDPERYAPQYGGYCAYGIALGKYYKVEGEQWSIVDGKLYLNYNAKWMKKWQKKQTKLIAKADKNYLKLTSK